MFRKNNHHFVIMATKDYVILVQPIVARKPFFLEVTVLSTSLHVTYSIAYDALSNVIIDAVTERMSHMANLNSCVYMAENHVVKLLAYYLYIGIHPQAICIFR